MFRILLADDERTMLGSLRKIITANSGNECDMRRVKTGRGVVRVAEDFRPDIAFVDIHMPGLSGIQVIQEVRKVDKEMTIIIITAYDKFTHAEEVMNLGVMEYLTKPISNKKIILDICMKTMQRVKEARQRRSGDLKIRERLEIVVPMIEGGFIYNMLQGDGADSSGYEELLGVREHYGFCLVLEFESRDENGKLTNVVGPSVETNKYYQVMREVVRDYFSCTAKPVVGNWVMLFVPSPEPMLKHEEGVEIITGTRTMLQKLEEYIGSDFRGGVGSTKTLGNTEESYGEALRVLRESVDHMVHITDTPSRQEDVAGEYPKELENSHYERRLKADSEETVTCGVELSSYIQGRYGCREDLEAKVPEPIMQLEYRMCVKDDTEFDLRPRDSYTRKIRGAPDSGKLYRWFLGKTRKIYRCVGTKRKKEMEYLVSTVRKYIDENYQKDISLDEISKMANTGPYYFSRLLKQGTGEDFIEYLTQTRMRQACICPRSPDYSIKQTCTMVRYSDPNYFSHIFEKYEGVNPSKYRGRMENGARKVQGQVQGWLRKGQRDHTGICKKRTAGNIVCMLFAALFSVLATSGCAETEGAATGSMEQEKQEVRVGLSFEFFIIERWIRERDVSMSTAKELGAGVDVQNANGDVEGQISQIEYFTEKQVDVIVAVAGDCEAPSDVMIKTRKARIKVVSYDRLTMNAGYGLHISFNNTEVGRLTAESVLGNILDGNDISLIQGPLTDNSVSLIWEGIDETLIGNNLNVVYEANCSGQIVENAYTYMKEGSKLDRNTRGIIYGNDDLTNQAFRALSKERLAGKVCVTGQDGNLATYRRIMEEVQETMAFKSVEQEISLATKYAVLLELGEEIEEMQDTAYDGTYNVSYPELQFIAATKENMDETIIKGGFHAKEGAYLSINWFFCQ